MIASFEQAIPPQRLILYTALLSALLLAGSLFWTQGAISSAENKRENLVATGEQIRTKVAHQEQNRLIIGRYVGKNPLYLHERLDTMALLSAELASNRTRLLKSALPEDALIEKRVQFLTSAENAFALVEGPLEIGSVYKETVEQQAKPVEVDNEDLLKIFSLLEEPHEDSPHLIISEARLERKKGISQEVWGLSLKVIRREYNE